MTPSRSVIRFPIRPSAGPWIAHETPRERILRTGAGALSDSELLSLLLPSDDASPPEGLAAALLMRCHGLAGLVRIFEAKPREIDLGEAQKAALLAAVEIARRLARARLGPQELLDRPAATAGYLALRHPSLDQEVMGALYLDVRNRLLAERELFRGTLSRTAVEPRAILKYALVESASGLILWHTHPSGDPSPSAEDLAFTRRVANASDLLGVRLIDHLILGAGGSWVSLQRRGAW